MTDKTVVCSRDQRLLYLKDIQDIEHNHLFYMT